MTDTATPEAITIPDLLQGPWTSAVVLTYSANLAFFESKLLSQLSQIPLRVILADQRRLADLFTEAADTGQRLRMANRAYVAGPIRHNRAAHAKAIVLTSAKEGLLIVGSGNLSQDGYASPGELWHVFAYDDDRRQHLAEFMTVRGLIDGLAQGGALDPPASEILRLVWSRCPWLPEPNHVPTTVRHNLEVSLADQLATEVSWDVEEMTAYAPFHDPDCAALSTLIERFRPRRLRLFIRGDTSVDADKLSGVLSSAQSFELAHVAIGDEARDYLHAKWVHLRGAKREALLTGSANLSRSALLNPADSGNLELGIISVGARGDFDHLYAPLRLTGIDSPHDLDVTFSPDTEVLPDAAVMQLLWSRLDGTVLTLTFDRPVQLDPALALVGPAGPITVEKITTGGEVILAKLEPQDAAALAEGGPIEVTLSNFVGITWPYHLASLRGRLERATNRDLLSHAAILPDSDSELLELLQELESTLIFDPLSVWRVAKPDVRQNYSDGDESSTRWEDLDWGRVRRDPRYAGYHYRGAGPGTPPTDIQVLLAAISGKLGDVGGTVDVAEGTGSEDERELAEPGDITTDAEDLPDDEDEDPARRQLAPSTKTRMAFSRFVTRYAAAMRNQSFTEKLGPVLAVHNAAIFNHLLAQLLSRNIVDPAKAVAAQLATWEFLWGSSAKPGVLQLLPDDEREAALRLIEETHVRSTTLRTLSQTVDYELPPELRAELRAAAIELITEPTFDLDLGLLTATEPRPDQAHALVRNIELLAGRLTNKEVADYVVTPLGCTHRDVQWRTEEVRRVDPTTAKSSEYRCQALVLQRAVDGLDHHEVRSALERYITATHFEDKPKDYWRIRFAGNRTDVGLWDRALHYGLTVVNGEDVEFYELEPVWPEWLSRLQDLESGVRRGQRRSA
jgi:hypothetical protein